MSADYEGKPTNCYRMQSGADSRARWTNCFVFADTWEEAEAIWHTVHPETWGWFPVEWTAAVPAHTNGVPPELLGEEDAAIVHRQRSSGIRTQ